MRQALLGGECIVKQGKGLRFTIRVQWLVVCLLLTTVLRAFAQDPGVFIAPEEGGPRHWEVQTELNLRAEASTSAAIVLVYARDTILNNLGCTSGEGRTWCYVQELGGGAVGYVAASYLTPAISPDGSVARGPDDSASRAGQGDFDATGTLPCAQALGMPTAPCSFSVARAGGGSATVVVTLPGGRKRAVFFQLGHPVGANVSEADYSGDFQAQREGDLNLVQVGVERFEIPDAVVLGG